MDIFEKAVREKTRFDYKGSISVEELWDLSLPVLDSIYGCLENELESLPKKSLLTTRSREREDVEFKQTIIKHIVEVKKAEADAVVKAKENADKKQMILSLIQEKQNESLKNLSVEELTKLAENL